MITSQKLSRKIEENIYFNWPRKPAVDSLVVLIKPVKVKTITVQPLLSFALIWSLHCSQQSIVVFDINSIVE